MTHDNSRKLNIKDVINTAILAVWFLFYALTFMVPKFYGFTENIVGVFVFVCLAALFFTNVNILKAIKNKETDFFLTAGIVLITGINLLLVNSGLGAFFTAADFAIIFYLSKEIRLKKWQLYAVGGMYLALMLYWFFYTYGWMFAEYGYYAMNTNTAATFTIFSLLCLFVLAQLLYEKHIAFGLFMVIIIVKGVQLSLYHRARGAFIMLIVFLLLRFVIPAKIWTRKGFFAALLTIATLGSLVFVAFYTWLGTTGVNFNIPFFYKNMFSGREAIWLEFWNLFTQKPLTGIGTNVTITSFFEFNVHNAMYDILVIHGVLVFAGTIVLIFRRLMPLRGKITNPVVLCAIASLIAVFFESFFDVDLIWTDYSLNLLFLLMAAHYREDANE